MYQETFLILAQILSQLPPHRCPVAPAQTLRTCLAAGFSGLTLLSQMEPQPFLLIAPWRLSGGTFLQLTHRGAVMPMIPDLAHRPTPQIPLIGFLLQVA